MSEQESVAVERLPSRRPPNAIGIVHLGLGAFHRAHQASVIEQCIAAGERDWGICSANLRSGRAMVERLRDGGYRYPLAEYGDSRHVILREIGAIREALFTGVDGEGRRGEDLEALLARMAHADTRIVTLTVTEKGYYLSPGEGHLLGDDPAIVFDLDHPHAPRTAPGIIVAALARRRAAGLAPFTVLSCDNMPDNGTRTRQAVVELARRRDTALAEWIEAEGAFPSSMVDRIVPAMNAEAFQRLGALGCDDPAAVMSERFLQWVVEDHFPLGRPHWEAAGVEMVKDVTPFETMKLRMLNGAHSLLAYVGPLLGFDTVAQAVSDARLRRLLARYMQDEAAPVLDMPPGVDLGAYGESLLARFANDSLHHRLQQIAMDGSQKLPQRWLSGARQRLAAAADAPAADIAVTAFGVAAWIRYTRGVDEGDQPLAVDDPMAARLAQCHRDHDDDPRALATAMLGIRDIFAPQLANDERFVGGVVQALSVIERHGTAEALQRLLNDSA